MINAYCLIKNKKWKTAVCLIILSILFHKTAILALPICYIAYTKVYSNKIIAILFLVGASILLIDPISAF
ncbi:EpsG family protein [Eubacterium limosum]|uniref:EpsG family protein n=1 Tax=Eubacterium limosum TaxID=1736 RepID=UPI00106302EA